MLPEYLWPYFITQMVRKIRPWLPPWPDADIVIMRGRLRVAKSRTLKPLWWLLVGLSAICIAQLHYPITSSSGRRCPSHPQFRENIIDGLGIIEPEIQLAYRSRHTRFVLCCRKMFATEKTHLLGNHRAKDARWNYRWIPYALLLLMCVGCNPILFLLHLENNLLAAISFPLDLLQERLWSFMKPILNAVTDEALRRTNDRSVRRLIRKSDSLATIGKTMLKVESTFITLVKVLSQAGFPLYLAAFSSIVLTGALALGTFCLFGPISEDAQRLKSSRDDSV